MRVVLTLLMFLVSSLIRPHRASCPPHWYVNGAWNGWYECRSPYHGNDCTVMYPGCVEAVDQTVTSYSAPLYCTGGATLRQDGRSAWCQR